MNGFFVNATQVFISKDTQYTHGQSTQGGKSNQENAKSFYKEIKKVFSENLKVHKICLVLDVYSLFKGIFLELIF